MAQVILTGIFGVFWTIFGLNAVLHFFPIPASSTEGAAFIYGGVRATGYIWPMMYASLVLTGAMLLSRRFVPLALILLALITFIVILYDLFLNPSGLVIGSM